MIRLGLLAVLAAPCGASAATVPTFTLAHLVSRADRIVVADVVDVQCAWDDRRARSVPVTLVTVRTLRTLKGPGSVQLSLEFLGGTVDGVRLDVPDLPAFRVGDREVLFLRDTPRTVSPIVGLNQGRFRVRGSADVSTGEYVVDHLGRALAGADAVFGSSRLADGRTSLASFEKRISQIASAQGHLPAVADRPVEGWDRPREPRGEAAGAVARAGRLEIGLGGSPPLIDGRLGWRGVIENALSRVRRAAEGTEEAAPRVGVVLSVGWGPLVLGRLVDEDALALSWRRTDASGMSGSVVLARGVAWNAYDGTLRRTPTGEPIFDMTRVAERELAAVLESPAPAPAGTLADEGEGVRGATSPDRATGRHAGTLETAAVGCADAEVVNPRYLTFESRDNAMMTSYEVGFFRPGADVPTQVLAVPIDGFALKLGADLPAWAMSALQSSLVVDIAAAGLGTPLGESYTYRVRGLFSGGATAWSAASQVFARCAASSTPRTAGGK